MQVAFVRPEWGQPCLSFFVCGSPNGTTAGSETYARPDLARARELLKESGYKGEPVVLLSSHETLFVGMATDYAAENLREIGLNIDQVESDWGTFMARRNSKKPPDGGGWNLFLTSVSGSGALLAAEQLDRGYDLRRRTTSPAGLATRRPPYCATPISTNRTRTSGGRCWSSSAGGCGR